MRVKFKFTLKIIGVLGLLAVVAAACGRDSSSQDVATETTAAVTVGTSSALQPGIGSPEYCAAQTPEATEIGISESTIKILVMADVGSPLAPGLFQGSIDGTKAWANWVNKNGGLACRQIEVIDHDSALNPIESTNGFLRACEEAFAMVGSTPLFALNTEAQQTCDDKAGNPTGIPDIAERAVEPAHECSPNTFYVSGTQGQCPYSGSGPRTYHTQSGGFKRLLNQDLPDAHGVFLIPSDLPSTIAALVPVTRAAEARGIVNDGEFGVSGFTPQAEFGTFLQALRDNDSNYGFNGSNDVAMLKWLAEAEAQGGFEDIEWGCILSCYTPTFVEDPLAEGVALSLNFLPFNEREHNEDLDTFLTEINHENDFPPSWAAGAWISGRLFQTVVEDIIAEEGINTLTRARVLEGLNEVTEYDGEGWHGKVDISTRINSPCFVSLRVTDGEYIRQHPAEPGTFDCSEENILIHTLDISEEFGN